MVSRLLRGSLIGKWAFLLFAIFAQGCDRNAGSRTTVHNASKSQGTDSGVVPVLVPGEHRSVPLQVARGEKATRFERIPAEKSGLTFRADLDIHHPMRRLFHSGFVCGGVSAGDIDGDGLVDLFFASGPKPNQLFRQKSPWQFEEITEQSFGQLPELWGTGATMVDIDNDGDLDIYVCNYDAPNQLFINNGTGRFHDQAAAFGLDIVDASLMATFADHDRDGDLDMYLLTNQYYRDGGRPKNPPIYRDKQRVPHVLPNEEKYFTLIDRGNKKFAIDDYGRDDRFYTNRGNGKFEETTSEAGIVGHGFGLSATWCDFNADGWPDIYVCNDFDDPDRLYRNNGDGSFRDVLPEMVPHTAWFSMGSDAGDVNNDGLMDIFMVDMSPTSHYKQKTTMGVMNADKLALVAGPPPQVMRNSLLINSGAGRFWEAAYLAGIADTDWSWATRLVDFDNDGSLDVFVGNGMIRNFNDSDIVVTDAMLIGQTKWDIYQYADERPEQNLAFRNLGNLQFEDVSHAWGLDHVGISYGTATADFDQDGDLDLIMVNMNEPVGLYENRSVDGNRLTLRLVGTASNKAGIGATVKIETSAGSQVRFVQPVAGFLGCSDNQLHFGLGQTNTASKVTIVWPSGVVQELADLSAGASYAIKEPAPTSGSPVALPPANGNGSPMADAMYTPSLVDVQHRETPFDDFQRQPLLPNKLSQLGPGIATGDFDGDGDDDLFVGGAAGQAGTLLKNKGDGTFEAVASDVLAADAACEDMGALFVDVDSDGDQDLYVVSGGVETEPGDVRLRDRLYLNDGSGSFTNAPDDALPDERDSGSTVAAADWDKDGDVDLFVGGRVVPGDYPMPAASHLLRNDQGKFTDVTEEIGGSGLATGGLVTSAVWTDLDQDALVDLAVAYEWGPVKIFLNRNGRLVDTTAEAGTGQHTGWWNGIDAGDLDADGDMDLIATNFGLNTKYHASLEHPALIYYGDFDKTGRKQLVEAEFENETLFPIRGKSCSTRAMPFLADKFRTFKDFAIADLNELYTPECLSDALRLEATTLTSSTFINNGRGQFEVRPLPGLAQVSPGFGIVIADLTGDGKNDAFVAQNFFTPQAETGRMDGGMGLLLEGQQDGSLKSISPQSSGLVVPGDAKSVVRCDINHDQWPDLIVGNNNDQVQLFVGKPTSLGRYLTVRLIGKRGNNTAIGARATLWLSDGSKQVAEVRAGSGYLSQSTADIQWAVPTGLKPTAIEVIWPTGERTKQDQIGEQSVVEIQQPEQQQ